MTWLYYDQRGKILKGKLHPTDMVVHFILVTYTAVLTITITYTSVILITLFKPGKSRLKNMCCYFSTSTVVSFFFLNLLPKQVGTETFSSGRHSPTTLTYRRTNSIPYFYFSIRNDGQQMMDSNKTHCSYGHCCIYVAFRASPFRMALFTCTYTHADLVSVLFQIITTTSCVIPHNSLGSVNNYTVLNIPYTLKCMVKLGLNNYGLAPACYALNWHHLAFAP